MAPTWQRIRRACPQEPLTVTAAGVTTELPRQHLFSIYVHAPPDYKGARRCLRSRWHPPGELPGSHCGPLPWLARGAGLEYQPLFLNHVIPTRLKTW